MAPRERPFAGKRILLTRSLERNRPLRDRLEGEGATIVEFPAIAVLPPEDPAPLRAAVAQLASYRWIAFASSNAVRALFEEMERQEVRMLPDAPRVGVVGEGTEQAVREYGAKVHCRPAVASGEALAEAMLAAGARGRVLVPRSDRALPGLRARLRAGGCLVDDVIAYRTVQPAVDSNALTTLRSGAIDAVVLASPSALAGVMAALGDNRDVLGGTRLVCIGPTTAEAVRGAGYDAAATAETPTNEGLMAALRTCLLENSRDE